VCEVPVEEAVCENDDAHDARDSSAGDNYGNSAPDNAGNGEHDGNVCDNSGRDLANYSGTTYRQLT
jgi:hypothetical protein